ncbi:MAG: substrate-binding domain-containing protein [Candidatus Acidiferrum sp.]
MLKTAQALRLRQIKMAVVCGVLLLCGGCRRSSVPTIAVIPRTSGTPLWEPVHAGAEIAARSTGTKVYWNAPTREDDVQGQIALVESVIERKYQGLVLAPDQALALITPVRRALSKGIPTVIIGSPLPIPPGGRLKYILNDEEEAGQMAAVRVGQLLEGKGSVAILGVNPDIVGMMIRARSLEETLARQYPKIRIVEKHFGSFNVAHDQLIAEETLRANPHLNAIVALTSASTRGACSALAHNAKMESTKVVGFDEPDPLLFQEINLDSLVIPNSHEMGISAVKMIAAQLAGQPVPAEVKLKPLLVTRGNLDSPELLEVRSMEWWRP